MIALTMHDMYESTPDLFVAGLATGSRGVAVFSFARYDPRDIHRLGFWQRFILTPIVSLILTKSDQVLFSTLTYSCQVAGVPPHPEGEPVDQLNKGEDAAAQEEAQEATNLR